MFKVREKRTSLYVYLPPEEVLVLIQKRPHDKAIYANRAMINMLKRHIEEQKFDEIRSFIDRFLEFHDFTKSQADMIEVSRLQVLKIMTANVPELAETHDMLNTIGK